MELSHQPYKDAEDIEEQKQLNKVKDELKKNGEERVEGVMYDCQ